jgi:hypothetical protein
MAKVKPYPMAKRPDGFTRSEVRAQDNRNWLKGLIEGVEGTGLPITIDPSKAKAIMDTLDYAYIGLVSRRDYIESLDIDAINADVASRETHAALELDASMSKLIIGALDRENKRRIIKMLKAKGKGQVIAIGLIPNPEGGDEHPATMERDVVPLARKAMAEAKENEKRAEREALDWRTVRDEAVTKALKGND